MSNIFDDEENLPGVITNVESDYSLGYSTASFGTTDSLVVIGTAFNGPVGTPIAVYSPEHAAYIFGGTYDSERRKEVSLVAGIKDAWDRGCRTIYGCRVSGKTIYKDFDLAIDTELKLRVASSFPTNVAKHCFFRYDNTRGDETIILYKPASRATIAEKKRGEVESAYAVMQKEIRLAGDYGYTRDTNLVDIIRYVNSNDANNVLKLSIVNSEGVDVTDSDEAYALPLGVIYPGVYFIGHDVNMLDCPEITQSNLIIADATNAPYANFDMAYFRKLDINTNVASDFPIYFSNKTKAAFKAALKKVGIVMTSNWDFLETSGVPEKAFALDDIDYEEISLSTFEIYKRLGMGYAITAKAEKRVDADGNELSPRIKETPASDNNRFQTITDGIYASLQNAEIDYRALVNVYADEEISSKLPRAKDFKQSQPEDINLFNENLVLTPIVDTNDLTKAKSYSITFKSVDELKLTEDEQRLIKTDEIYEIVDTSTYLTISELETALKSKASKLELTAGSTFLVDNILVRVSNTGGITLLNTDEYENKHIISANKIYVGQKATSSSTVTFVTENADNTGYILGEAMDSVFVYSSTAGSEVLSPIGDLSTLIGTDDDDNEATISVFATNMPFATNDIIISSHMFDNITMSELVNAINNHKAISKIFVASLSADGAEFKDDMVKDIASDYIYGYTKADGSSTGVVYSLPADRSTGYNYNLYIPYRTTDNFARQLAQHCTQTEIYTHPTHGFIGCKRQTDNGLTAVANRVNSLKKHKFDLYAKTVIGKNMTDRNGYPYPIGKNISVVFGQHYVNMDTDNYTYLSCGGPSYAGMVSVLPLDQAPTCQPINIQDTTFTLTNSQLVSLTAAGIVTFRESFTKGIVVTDGITMAPADSAFRRLSTTRNINSIEDLIRQKAEPFIGKQNNDVNRNSLRTAITAALGALLNTLIQSYTLNLNTDENADQMTYIDIDYTIRPINEIREVRNTIKVQNGTD